MNVRKSSHLFSLASLFCVAGSQLTPGANLLVNGGLEDVSFGSTIVDIPEYGPDPFNFPSAPNSLPTAAQISPPELGGWRRTVQKLPPSITGLPSGDYYNMPAMQLVQNGAAGYTPTPYGSQFGFFADLNQEVRGLTVGQEYELSGQAIIDLTQDQANAGINAWFRLEVYDLADLSGSVLNFTSSATEFGFPEPLFSEELQFTADGGSPDWRELSLNFVAPSDELAIRVYKQSFYDPANALCNWDNVSLVAVPEPGSPLLFAISLSAMLLRRPRR